jgi:hypothetical protein
MLHTANHQSINCSRDGLQLSHNHQEILDNHTQVNVRSLPRLLRNSRTAHLLSQNNRVLTGLGKKKRRIGSMTHRPTPST